MQKVRLEPNNRYLVHLECQKDKKYYCWIEDDLNTVNMPKFPVDLGKETFIGNFRLGEVVKTLKSSKPKKIDKFFQIDRQKIIGNHLYQQIFGHWLNRVSLGNESVDIGIIVKDEFLSLIPWVLMADGGIFLASQNWHFFQSRQVPNVSVELGKYPEMLIIIPEPENCPKTSGPEHLKDLKNLLSETMDGELVSSKYMRVISSLKELQKMSGFSPQIIYYYGHGEYKNKTSNLLFEKENKQSQSVPVIDFNKEIKKFGHSLKLVYLNCCSGDIAGFLGAGNQLSENVPIVITNRTAAYVDSSRKIAIDFFSQVLGDDVPPVTSINRISSEWSQLTIRHFSTVCYSRCRNWNGGGARKKSRAHRASDWIITLDRGDQCGRLIIKIHNMIKYGKPRSLCFFWYGDTEEGVDVFHERLRKEMKDFWQHKIALWDETIHWPEYTDGIEESFEERFCEVFNVSDLNDIPTAMGKLLPYSSNRTRFALIDHLPIEIGKTKRFSPNILKSYMNWWANRLVPIFPEDIFILLGISFVVSPDRIDTFSNILENIRHGFATELFSTELLPRLKKLEPNDLTEFFRTHSVLIPPGKWHEVAVNILKNTGGKYTKTLDILKRIEKEYFYYLDKESDCGEDW